MRNGRQALDSLEVTVDQRQFDSELLKTQLMLIKAESAMQAYDTHRLAAAGFEANDELDEAEVLLQGTFRKL